MLEIREETLGQINMESNLERDLHKRSQNLKKDIKNLQELLGRIYTSAKQSNNNKLIYIKRDVDKLNSVSNYINNLDLPSSGENRGSSFNKDITDLYNATVKNIEKMQELYKKQEDIEKKDTHYNGRFFSDQKNLDNLRMASSNIRQMGIDLRMSKQDWNEIEKK